MDMSTATPGLTRSRLHRLRSRCFNVRVASRPAGPLRFLTTDQVKRRFRRTLCPNLCEVVRLSIDVYSTSRDSAWPRRDKIHLQQTLQIYSAAL